MTLPGPDVVPLRQAVTEHRREYLLWVLDRCKGRLPMALAAAKISLATAYRIVPEIKYEAAKRKKLHSDKAKIGPLLIFFGVLKAGQTHRFWEESEGQLDEIYHDAKRNYLAMVKALHPDTNPNDGQRLADINVSWRRLKELFRDHGVEC